MVSGDCCTDVTDPCSRPNFVIDIQNGECEPSGGFTREASWPEGRFVLTTGMSRIEPGASSDLTQEFEEVVNRHLKQFETSASVVDYVSRGRGALWMLITFDPVQGSVCLPPDFLSGWSALGGRIEIDIPLDP